MRAKVSISPDFVIAPVSRRTFGSFVEHMGRCVYTGIYEPGHPTADAEGFRVDVLDLVRELGVTTVRYPGGNFVSGYQWEDGVGPRDQRPVRLEPAWHSIESNQFGLNEFMAWAQRAGVEPMMAINLGTRGVAEALNLLEYTNHPAGTTLSDLRISHGAVEPHGVTMWCLGNEMDGPWQLGHKTAHEYGRLAAETARAMRQYQPGLELVACGSSNRRMPTFGSWEATVLEHTYDDVDFISAHVYYELDGDDYASFLGASTDLERFIVQVAATADHVGAKLKSDKRIDISFDEWNVWYLEDMDASGKPEEWTAVPRISEEAYTALDAVVVGSLLITLLRHSDRVTAASQAQLVNTLGSIRSEPGGPAWRQTMFYPFSLMAKNARGVVLDARVEAQELSTVQYGDVGALDTVVTFDAESGRLAIFSVNRSTTEAMELAVDIRAFGQGAVIEAVQLTDDDFMAANTEQDPLRVVPQPLSSVDIVDGVLRTDLRRASWNMVVVDTSMEGSPSTG